MPTSSSLYFHAPGAGLAPRLLARGNGNITYPHGLWMLLLGDATPWTPAAGEQAPDVEGDALQVSAVSAVARFEAFSSFVQSHPLIGRIPELPVFLEGVLAFLRERLAPFGEHPVLLIAQTHGQADEPLAQAATRYHARWQAMASIMERQAHHMLDALFYWENKGYDFTYGRVWVQPDGFGIHSLAHPWFRALAQLYADQREHAPDAAPYDSAPYEEPVAVNAQDRAAQAQRIAAYQSPWPYEEWSEYMGDGHFVRQGAQWGFHARERLVLPCEFDRFDLPKQRDHYLRIKGARVWQNGKAGWVRADGKLVVPCQWDDVVPTYATGLFSVLRDGRWGLVDRRKRQLLPCAFAASLVPLAFGRDLPQPEFSPDWDEAPATYFSDVDVSSLMKKAGGGQQLVLAARGPHGGGAVDQAGEVLVPLAYAQLEMAAFSKHRDARWFKVTSHAGLHGVWSVEAQREVVPCEHEWLTIIIHPDLSAPLFVTGDQQRFRLWNSDGSAWSPHAMRWITDHLNHLQEPWPGYEHGVERKGFTLAWVEDRPMRAMVVNEAHPQGRAMLFSRTQALRIEPMSPPRETLELAWATRGDRTAAQQLSDSAALGFLEPKDEALARLWAARACGEDPAPESAVEVSEALPLGAASSFFRMLERGIGGPRDARRARYWAGRAAQQSSYYYVQREHVRLLLDQAAGPVEPEQALEIIGRYPLGTREGNTFAAFHAHCLIEGLGTPVDWPAARELLYVSHRCNDREGAPMMADLLRRWAATLPPDDARTMLAEAAYHQARTDNWPNRLPSV